LKSKHSKYVKAVSADLSKHKKHNKRSIEKLARSFGIENKNLVKEFTELAIVKIARVYSHAPSLNVHQRYNSIVKLYQSQVNLSHRTSESIRLQQYSTPAPIAYLAGVFCGMDKKPKKYYFEPSAGNGLLTIAAKPEWFIVNEIDDIRNQNLKSQAYKRVLKKDASKTFYDMAFLADAVITNPPFGVLAEKETTGNFSTKTLDHLMAAVALQTMKHNGKAAIIIGGHTHWDKRGRIQKGKNRDFFMWLYHNYHVMDVINIDGHKLYSRQGTAFDVRLILIDGRKIKPEGYPPLKRITDIIIDTFEGLFARVIPFVSDDELLKKAKSISNMCETAKQLGQTAFGNGLIRIASRDTELLKMLKSRQVGDNETTRIMMSWYKGWDMANLAQANNKTDGQAIDKMRIKLNKSKAIAKLKLLELKSLRGIPLQMEINIYDSHTGKINEQVVQSYRQAIEIARDWVNEIYPDEIPKNYSINAELQYYNENGEEEMKKRRVIKILTAAQINSIRKSGFQI